MKKQPKTTDFLPQRSSKETEGDQESSKNQFSSSWLFSALYALLAILIILVMKTTLFITDGDVSFFNYASSCDNC